jgi:fibronectin type III domain protein
MMAAFLLVLAFLFALNVVLVLVFGLIIEVRRRRDHHEVTKLERLWRSPAASIRSLGERGRAARFHGKHVSVLDRDAVPRGRPGAALGVKHTSNLDREAVSRSGLGTVSLVVTCLAVVSVLVAAVLDPSDGASRASSSSVDEVLGPFVDGAVGTDGKPSGDRLGRSADGGVDAPDASTPSEATVGSPASAGGNTAAEQEAGTVSGVVAATSASSTAIRLTWNEVPTATGYEVERSGVPSDQGAWLTIVTTPAGVSAYTDDGLAAGTTYYYRVTAVLEHGVAPTSDVVSATTASPPPSQPILTAKSRKSGIILAWTDVEGETGYRVERQTADGTGWLAIATTGEGVAEYKDGSLSPGMTYRYRVVAIGPGGESVPSDVVEATASIGLTGSPPGQSDDDPSTQPDGHGSEASHEHATAP